MHVPVSGTSAYKYEQKVVTVRKSKPKNTCVNKKRTRNNIISISFITLMAFTLLTRSAYITEKSTQLNALKDKYETVNSMLIGKQFELEQKTDLKSIAESAAAMGMRTPEKHQIVYIDMQNSNYAESNIQNSNTFFAAIGGTLSNALEYFR